MVSVIIPVYRVEPYLDQCVASILGQTFRDLEILLVDDGSPDRCGAMCDAWAARDSRIRVLHRENGGVSAARNAGLAEARGDMVLFLDGDDMVSPHLVQTLLDISAEGRLAAAGFVRFSDAAELPEAMGSRECRQMDTPFLHRLRSGDYCWGVLYSRHVISRLQLQFREELGNLEDVLWNGAYAACVNSIAVTEEPMYYYRVNPRSITSRSVDRVYQARSWAKARAAVLEAFRTKSADAKDKSRWKRVYRKCMNNFYSEARMGHIPAAQARAMLSGQGDGGSAGRWLFAGQVFTDRCFLLEWGVYQVLLWARRRYRRAGR